MASPASDKLQSLYKEGLKNLYATNAYSHNMVFKTLDSHFQIAFENETITSEFIEQFFLHLNSLRPFEILKYLQAWSSMCVLLYYNELIAHAFRAHTLSLVYGAHYYMTGKDPTSTDSAVLRCISDCETMFKEKYHRQHPHTLHTSP